MVDVRCGASCCSLALASLAFAQTVWTVPATGDLAAAVAAAVPGDILVLSSTALHAPFTVSIPAGQTAHLHDIDFRVGQYPLYPAHYGCPVQVTSGTVRIESCLMGGHGPMLWAGNGAHVTVSGTTIQMEVGVAAVASGARLTLRDCAIYGADARCDLHTANCSFGWTPAMPALQATAAVLHVERVT